MKETRKQRKQRVKYYFDSRMNKRRDVEEEKLQKLCYALASIGWWYSKADLPGLLRRMVQAPCCWDVEHLHYHSRMESEDWLLLIDILLTQAEFEERNDTLMSRIADSYPEGSGRPRHCSVWWPC